MPENKSLKDKIDTLVNDQFTPDKTMYIRVFIEQILKTFEEHALQRKWGMMFSTEEKILKKDKQGPFHHIEKIKVNKWRTLTTDDFE
jgi:hypothetical protein